MGREQEEPADGKNLRLGEIFEAQYLFPLKIVCIAVI